LVSYDIFFGADILEDILLVLCWHLGEPHISEDAKFLARFNSAKILLRTPEVLHSVLKLQRLIDIEISDISGI
jgi:hypothetical protein